MPRAQRTHLEHAKIAGLQKQRLRTFVIYMHGLHVIASVANWLRLHCGAPSSCRTPHEVFFRVLDVQRLVLRPLQRALASLAGPNSTNHIFYFTVAAGRVKQGEHTLKRQPAEKRQTCTVVFLVHKLSDSV